MTQDTYRVNLTASAFPFLSMLCGSTVISPRIDQSYSRSNGVKNVDANLEIPQIYYMHNVMPTDAGVTSVGYQLIVNSPIDTDNTFSDMYYLRDDSNNFAYLNCTSSGRNYVFTGINTGWIRTTDKAALPGLPITTAHVNGQTYIYFGGVGCFTYNYTTNALTPVVLTSLDPTKIIGICASNGYMIAWTSSVVNWSSIVSPIDFTPSLISGAGGGGVQTTKASITVCLPHNNGFVTYTKRNAVFFSYTGNGQYPFSSRELIGAGGVADFSMVAYDGNSADQFAYTTAGLQQIGINTSDVVFPQVTDFIAGAEFEDFNDTSNSFETTYLVTPMKKKLVMIANRYLVISYGVTNLTHAIIYDVALARWGKLKINHVDCFNYTYPSADVVEAPKRSIGFVQADGTVLVAVLSYNSTGSMGTVVMGEYQLDHNRLMGIQEIHVDSVAVNTNPAIKILSSINGVDLNLKSPVLVISKGTFRRYNCNISGLYHSIIITGAFHLNSIKLRIADEGEVR